MKWFENKTDKKDNKAFVVTIGVSELGTINEKFPASLKNNPSKM